MEVVVATPERVDGLLRTNPEIAHHLRCVVVDEAHLIQNDTRGVLLEGVITRLLLLRGQGRNIRLILLSAVLARYDRLKEWIGCPTTWCSATRGSPRPGGWPSGARAAAWFGAWARTRSDDPEPRTVRSSARWICPPESSFYAASNPGYAKKQAPLIYRNVAFLADLFRQRYADPILCFCPTKESTRMAALALRMPSAPGGRPDQGRGGHRPD